MAPASLSDLLKLPPRERAELAIALWDSLNPEQRETESILTSEQEAELDRRWAQHLQDPDSAIPWEDVRRRLSRAS